MSRRVSQPSILCGGRSHARGSRATSSLAVPEAATPTKVQPGVFSAADHQPADGTIASPPTPTHRFRPEIEGLRAVAAILVAVYHVFLGRVSGGVDVFFVVAGFLITTSLLGHVERVGRPQVGRFVGRLASRLLPVAVVVLVAISAATLLWMPITRLAATFDEVVASALYYENWLLAAKAVDYLARDDGTSPLQHFWALSIQGQFYLVWLALFGLAVLLADRARIRRSIGAALALVFVGSLFVSVALTDRNQPLAYFHTGARMWEFAAGGLLALAIARLPRAWGRLSLVGGWVGLAMIVSCGVLIPVSTSFPGWIALWPVVGALLVIAAGDSRHRWASSRLLGSRPFVFVGGVAYALYLWHWPILIFYRLQRGGDGPVGIRAGLAILAVSFVLAVVTTPPGRAADARHALQCAATVGRRGGGRRGGRGDRGHGVGAGPAGDPGPGRRGDRRVPLSGCRGDDRR